MAAKGPRENIILECTECKRRNYMTSKNKRNNTSVFFVIFHRLFLGINPRNHWFVGSKDMYFFVYSSSTPLYFLLKSRNRMNRAFVFSLFFNRVDGRNVTVLMRTFWGFKSSLFSTISLVIEALNVPISPNLIFLPLSSSSSNWVRRASITPLTSAEVIVQLLEMR